MARAHRRLMTGAVIVCLISAQWNGRLFASEDELTGTVSETQASTSAEVAPAVVMDEHPAATTEPTTEPSSALPQMERFPFTLNAGDFTASPLLGPAGQGAHRTFDFLPAQFLPAQSSAFAGQVYQGRPYRIGRDGSLAAIMVGSVVAIAGAAILIYANRPECDVHQFAGGCGYGTKVVGGAVLSGGIVSLVVGALTWR
jgi:hypothetical protein